MLNDPKLWCTGAYINGQWVTETPHGSYDMAQRQRASPRRYHPTLV
jgi:hypothetical protein